MFPLQFQRKAMPKKYSNYHTIAFTSHISKVMLKILQSEASTVCELRTFRCSNWVRKGRESRGQIANICWMIEKNKRAPEKYLLLLYWLHQSLWLWITTKFFKRWEYQTTLPASWEICIQDKKQQLESDMEQRTGSKLEKEYAKSVYCHHVYLTDMQSI